MLLNQLSINQYAKIKKIDASPDSKRRFLDLGMVEGTKIVPILKSPLGDPIAYEVRGCLIAIRKEDSKKIEVLPI